MIHEDELPGDQPPGISPWPWEGFQVGDIVRDKGCVDSWHRTVSAVIRERCEPDCLRFLECPNDRYIAEHFEVVSRLTVEESLRMERDILRTERDEMRRLLDGQTVRLKEAGEIFTGRVEAGTVGVIRRNQLGIDPASIHVDCGGMVAFYCPASSLEPAPNAAPDLANALERMVNEMISTTADRTMWWCNSDSCNGATTALSMDEIRHRDGCPVPLALAALARAKGEATT